ncbi:unnamed protein product [Rhizophagus irregularis]|uniref:Uncharacterized protein n=1 Tax=Rhizophagus irregularis TaxID=588596 RepID=A0A915ZHT6_9GLOM|nr:unnamed protein product [Rhizophagus irregularis]CAB5217522.1 unnamed protein product [Rhizophagus irregularis]CAB5377472.1 unnamed protein product [Rhizophagus irregularis]
MVRLARIRELFQPNFTDDRMLYSYIALGYTTKDSSFYASLHTKDVQQSQVVSRTDMEISNNSVTIEDRDSCENTEVNNSAFALFLEDKKNDYESGNMQLCSALNKFAERYKVAKLKSIPRLVSFLYDMNSNLNPVVNIRSGSMIRVQVESIKRRKTEGSGCKRKLPFSVKEKENLDPQVIPHRKKRKTNKKDHNLSENVLNNQLN